MILFWTVVTAALFLVLFLLLLILLLVSRALFRMGIERKGNFSSGSGNFAQQLAAHKEMFSRGEALYESLEKIPVEIRSFDGLWLRGHAICTGESKKTVILVHGYRSSGIRDFSGIIPFYWDAGFNILLIDQRAHGESEGDYITFGVRERRDVLSWARFAVEFFGADHSLILDGISMGATSVLMACALELPAQVRGIVADSGFVSPHDIFSSVLKNQFHLGTFPLLNMTERLAARRAGFRFGEASTLTAMASNAIPVLFVHGGADDFVPVEMTLASYEACSATKALVIVPGAAHACGYLIDPVRCETALREFFGRIFKNE